MKGAAMLRNGCKDAIGIGLKATGDNSAGAPDRTSDFSPAGIRYIPPGDDPISLDQEADYDPEMKHLDVRVIAIRHW
jgi:hypothetical protein